MLGIGLGAFAQGFTQGYGMGKDIREDRKKRKLEDTIAGITDQGKADYDAKVAAGTEEPDNFEASYASYVVPKIQNAYLLAGDPDTAAAWGEWAEKTSSKKASKLFGQGLQKIQMGDVQGGIDAMIKAANTSGYGPEGKMTAAEYYDEAAGKVTGYRFTFTTPDGKEHTKNVAVDDLGTFFSSTVNPQAAFEMEQATKAKRSEADLEVETHIRKKKGEKELGVGEGAMTEAQYQNAIQEERKRIEDAALTDDEISEMTAEEKEALAKELVDKRLGNTAAAPAAPQVAVDPETGEKVEAPAPAPADQGQSTPTDSELGVGAPAEEEEAPAEEEQAPAGGGPIPSADQPGMVAPTPAAETSQVPDTQRQAHVARAAQLMQQGGNAQEIARALIAAGVPPEQWPQDVQLAARKTQLGVAR